METDGMTRNKLGFVRFEATAHIHTHTEGHETILLNFSINDPK